MLRYVIPVVAGCCGLGAERLCSTQSETYDRHRPAETRYAESYREAPRGRFAYAEQYASQEQRYEPSRGRSWHVDVGVQKYGRSERGSCDLGGERREPSPSDCRSR